MDRRELRLLVERDFHLGFKNQVILDFLKNRHGKPISLSTLKCRLRDYGLKRRGAQIEDQELREILLREISGPGQLRGYRAVWHSLRLKHRIHLPRERVAYFLQELNPTFWQTLPDLNTVRTPPSYCMQVRTRSALLPRCGLERGWI